MKVGDIVAFRWNDQVLHGEYVEPWNDEKDLDALVRVKEADGRHRLYVVIKERFVTE